MLRHFGFLCTAEFTVPNLASFSPVILLSLADIAIKTDPLHNGCHIHIGLGRAPLCKVQPLPTYLSCQGNILGLLFLLANGQPLSHSILTD